LGRVLREENLDLRIVERKIEALFMVREVGGDRENSGRKGLSLNPSTRVLLACLL
jgi:hypothetical protein